MLKKFANRRELCSASQLLILPPENLKTRIVCVFQTKPSNPNETSS
jgi:hypothetical protein